MSTFTGSQGDAAQAHLSNVYRISKRGIDYKPDNFMSYEVLHLYQMVSRDPPPRQSAGRQHGANERSSD